MIELGRLTFAPQKEATAYFQAMLGRYSTGERVSEEHAHDLADLLRRHPDHAQKVGCGIRHFTVELTDYGSKGFRIVRTDGSGTDFSYLRCISGRAPSRKQEVARAFRQVVKVDIFDARDRLLVEHAGDDGLIACAATGERIHPDQGHMDHRPPMTFEATCKRHKHS